MSGVAPKVFAEAASRAAKRITLAAGLRILGKSAAMVFGVALAGWLVLRLVGMRDATWWAFGLVIAWLVGTGLFVWLRRPKPFEALATWDRAAAARESLASAWSFEQAGSTDVGAVLHLSRAGEQLRARSPQLKRDLPLKLAPAAWIAPLVFLAFVLSGWLRMPIEQEDAGLSADARIRAATAGKELAEQTKVVDPMKSLTEEEKKKLEALRQEMEKSAKGLDRLNTPREILEELERKARDAEKLAETLRSEDSGALSGSFLAELERNADTADLGSSLRAGDLEAAAEQARITWARLGSRKPSLEEQKRLEEALKRAMDAANKKDRESNVGRRLGEAQKQLSAGSAGGAAQQYDELAKELSRSAQRNQAQQQLRNLAQNFRSAGSQIFGGQNLQRLTPQTPSGSMPLAGMPQLIPGTGTPGSSQGMQLVPSPGSVSPNAQIPLLIPGTGTPNSGQSFPIPGSGQNSAGNSMPMPIPGTGGQNPGNGAFPIPGMGGGLPIPIPGAGAAMAGAAGANGAGVGGSEAGRGTADLGGDPTKPLAATQTGAVAPTPGAEGPSERRAVAGVSHREAPARSRQQIASDFLKAEEAALAEEPLPASRREQILRYFTAIRQQLERQP